MSALLRSVRVLQTLKNVTGYALNSSAVKKPIFNSSNHVGVRFLSVQPAVQFTKERERYRYGVDDLLGKLDQEGRRTGRLSSRTVNQVHTQLCSQSSVNSTQALLLLRCYGSLLAEMHPKKRTQLAHDVWQKLETLGVPLDLSHYNTLLLVYLENEHEFDPVDFLAKMEQNGVQPNRVTYQRLVARYAQMGNIEGINKVLEFMKEKSLSINDNIFHSLILGHARANDMESAIETLQLMQQSGLEPSMETYSVLSMAQAEKGDIDGINSTIALSMEKEQPLQDRHLLEVVYTLTVNGHKQHVPELLSTLKKGMGYNLDCITVTLRLVTAGHDDVARQLYDTLVSMSKTNSQSNLNNGAFYVRQLIASNRPLSTIVEFCDDACGSNTHLLLRGLETALNCNRSLVYPLMDAVAAKGDRLRPHYFWPIIVQAREAKDTEGIYQVLENMSSRGVPITMATMVDYVLPGLLEEARVPSDEVIERCCQKYGFRTTEVMNALTRYYLLSNDINSAVQTVTRYGSLLGRNLVRDLSLATCRSHDYQNAATLLSYMIPNKEQLQHEEEDAVAPAEEAEDAPPVTQQEDTVGSFLRDMAYKMHSGRDQSVDFPALLQAVQDRGLSISQQNEAAIVRVLRNHLTPQIQNTLSILASGTLKPVPLERSRHNFRSGFSLSRRKALEEEYEKLREQGLDTRESLLRLMNMYLVSSQLEKAEETMKTLAAEHKDSVTVGTRLRLMDLYYKEDQLQPALDMLAAVNAQDPDASIMPTKILKLVHMLVKNGRIDEAIALMEAEGKKTKNETDDMDTSLVDSPQQDYFVDNLCSSIVRTVSESFDTATVDRVTKAIFDNNLAKQSYRILAAAIKGHLLKGDLDGAFDALMTTRKQSNVLPCKHLVMKELIKMEDTTRLQQIILEDTQLRGESASMFDLALCFMELDSLRQAKKVLESSDLYVTQWRVESAFSRFLEQGDIKNMENLLSVTTSLHGLDRVPFYCSLLNAYKKENNYTSALSLWTQMQEESLPISEQFLIDLGNFLKSNGQEVPFTIPTRAREPQKVQPQQAGQVKRQPTIPKPKVQVDPALTQYRALLQEGKTNEALAEHPRIVTLEQSAYSDTLELMKQLLDQDRLTDCLALLKSTPRLKNLPFRRFSETRQLLALMAKTGDMDAIKSLMDDSPNNVPHIFARALCRAASRCNRVDECFQLYQDFMASAAGDDQKLHDLKMNFPRSGFLWLVHQDESLLPKLEEMSVKNEQLLAPVQSTLWAYHFMKNNTEKMDQLRQTAFTDGEEKLPLSAVCSHMREAQDVSMAPRLLEQVQKNPAHVGSRASDIVFDCWIDVLSADKPREALQVLESKLKTSDISSVSRIVISKLKNALAKEGVDFPYKLTSTGRQTQSKSSSSSSSDSDEEKGK